MSTEPTKEEKLAVTAPADETPVGAHFRAEWQRLGLIPADDAPKIEAPEPDIAAIVRDQRMTRFKEFCPKQYRVPIDRDKIRNLAAWDKADEWNGSHPGCWLWSHDTGEAKTRMLWRKFGQLHVQQGRVVCRVTGAALAEEYHDAFQKSRTSAFYAELTKYDILMLDDLDKMPLPRDGIGYAEVDQAERNARMLREVFDKLYENLTPVLVTANEPIAWFGARVGPSTDRRMREVCAEIEF